MYQKNTVFSFTTEVKVRKISPSERAFCPRMVPVTDGPALGPRPLVNYLTRGDLRECVCKVVPNSKTGIQLAPVIHGGCLSGWVRHQFKGLGHVFY